MANIIILGAGIGGMSAAYEIRDAIGKEHAITVVGDGPVFNFTPSNPWLAVGWRKPDEIRLNVTEPLESRNIRFVPTRANKVVAEANRLDLVDGSSLNYDYLVITTGPRLAFERVPGSGPEGFTQSVCTGPHAEKAWLSYEEFLKKPGPVVVGALQGASCFGPAYEFAMILDTDLRRRKLRDRVPMTFVTSEPYIGHMGLGGIGDSKGLLESEMRQRHIKWISNARVTSVEQGKINAEQLDEQSAVLKTHELPFSYSMFIPPFAGVDAVQGIEGLTNPGGFILIDEHQCNPTFPNIFAAGVCVAIPPVEVTPVPTGAPKTGLMIESMVTAIANNLRDVLAGKPMKARATWNAMCLADMGDSGFAFIALPQIPPRNVTKAMSGKWVHLAKVAYEKYFLRKMRKGKADPIYETYVMKAFGIDRLKLEENID
ncbi:MAG TPA: FAD/NAD(P)-binding oxidoreductase [Marinospirillum sp.]|jgi:sulfide:quinone oxidoreductase|uniref:NAD(P)/FAD-dependent oxidoreductase n=1 Tax=Marinospirillum sp. TaxID=2183934 RepID=UPI000AE932FF|nr:FAD/NAD(P)-binding oxidoreductase [Marinospirillum sp.]MDD2222719.1 FAD/NAD(P)-binding oxidoreductase [Pseudomonas sp.]MDY0415262.1 FAD/NAD(P)-binding oxidoreductase [Pseudomonas sp.]NLO52915.1 NAD(P)/FAD-dependent oxidoreductase [Gammaproteobacteria bacterium]HKM14822.1 FAD/NAD(P)-binding oxidoreductase [Marinospirillum sp.]